MRVNSLTVISPSAQINSNLNRVDSATARNPERSASNPIIPDFDHQT